MSEISGLGHVGLYCHDLKRMREFYSGFLGLTIADEDPGRGVCFLSAAPETEHHELVLVQAKESEQKTRNVQQVSFKVKSLEGVRAYYHRLRKDGMKIDRTVTHGNACSVYFFDPEDNRVELYFTTPYKVRQPFGEHIDLDRPDAELLAFAQSFEEKKGPPRGAQPAR
jgi:catechol 2,3-dioxygenase-like lactoylglutathione lyase family enzyme